MTPILGRRAGLGFVLLAGIACNDPPAGPTPTSLELIHAPSAVGAPGWELIDTLVVRAVDPSGGARAGVAVTWTVRQGGGSIAPLTGTTDIDGYARAVWTLGAVAGLNRARASNADGAEVEFESVGEAFRIDRMVARWGIGCGLEDGDIWCWGASFWAPGDPPSHHKLLGWRDAAPGRLDAPVEFVDLSVTWTPQVCGLDGSGAVWCATAAAPEFAPKTGLPAIRQLTSAEGTHCGLAVSDSAPWCWVAGQPTPVAGVRGLTGLWFMDVAGIEMGCGLLADSTAVCWGEGILGDGSSGSSSSPVSVAGNHRFVELALGYQLACGRTSAGQVWCWGHDATGDLLTPTLAVSGAYALGAESPWIQVLLGGGQTVRWEGAAFGPPIELTGLAGLSIDRYGSNNNPDCVQQADDQVYCIDQTFKFSSAVGWENYSPVQPVRRPPR